jgi:hypothetical protein
MQKEKTPKCRITMAAPMLKSFLIQDIRAARHPVLRDTPIAFHGVNKSGSLAMATVLKNSFALQNAGNRFMCRYMSIPETRDEAIKRIVNDNGSNQILIDHGLVGLEKKAPSVKMITMLRHPIRRIISAYYWLSTHHPESVMGRDLLNWVRLEGRHHSQIRQFAFDHFSPQERGRIVGRSISEITRRALDYFEDNIAWFGITEMFKESTLALHWELGLDQIGKGMVDDRNKDRPTYLKKEITNGDFDHTHTSISKAYYEELEQYLAFDIVFYEVMKRKFRSYLADFEMDSALNCYKESEI